MEAVAVAPLEQIQIGSNGDGYGQGKTSKGLRQGFYLPISDVMFSVCPSKINILKNHIK